MQHEGKQVRGSGRRLSDASVVTRIRSAGNGAAVECPPRGSLSPAPPCILSRPRPCEGGSRSTGPPESPTSTALSWARGTWSLWRSGSPGLAGVCRSTGRSALTGGASASPALSHGFNVQRGRGTDAVTPSPQGCGAAPVSPGALCSPSVSLPSLVCLHSGLPAAQARGWGWPRSCGRGGNQAPNPGATPVRGAFLGAQCSERPGQLALRLWARHLPCHGLTVNVT